MLNVPKAYSRDYLADVANTLPKERRKSSVFVESTVGRERHSETTPVRPLLETMMSEVKVSSTSTSAERRDRTHHLPVSKTFLNVMEKRFKAQEQFYSDQYVQIGARITAIVGSIFSPTQYLLSSYFMIPFIIYTAMLVLAEFPMFNKYLTYLIVLLIAAIADITLLEIHGSAYYNAIYDCNTVCNLALSANDMRYNTCIRSQNSTGSYYCTSATYDQLAQSITDLNAASWVEFIAFQFMFELMFLKLKADKQAEQEEEERLLKSQK
ncbi:hypothetical protein EDD86DRAFT_247088 [Gorgonomyces haynaldii]|nr:hypothetical protein EDD86DRAFT_247088 [Gorgonomyces haynaldii]